jgi:predicted 2-oxoglutarate/Fe(II)-dependent dioxygenase YbiX
MSERSGYREATVETEKGSRLIREIRNNLRVLHKDEQLAHRLWERAKDYAPAKVGNSIATGLNELFRFYKYEQGQEFKRHIDESYIRNEHEASYYTFMMYLNDAYSGGETVFEKIAVTGTRGMLLVFLHSLPHEGSAIKNGIKYVLRTDIMYRLAENDN